MNDESTPDGSEAGVDALRAGRLAHHERLLAEGVYPYRYERSHTAGDLHATHGALEPGVVTDQEVAVAGRVILLRSFGKLVFATLRDGSGTIQLFVDSAHLSGEAFDRFGEVDLGDWVGAAGRVMTTKKGELSVRVDDFSLLQKSLRPLPD
jgi:lysyl-tRNA synthetase class 2